MKILISTNRGEATLVNLPNTCPFCHKSVIAKALVGQINSEGHSGVETLEVSMSCPNFDCQRLFIAYYNYEDFYHNAWKFNGILAGGNIKGTEFSESVNRISPAFSKIYNQAFHAEQIGLNEICGVGYRKALEFLIKDYAKGKSPNDHEKIEKKMLAPCINDYVTDIRIQSVAKRAVWLGNDETHYIRKWENKDLSDLKKLIDLTIHWIEMEILSESIEIDMQE